MALRALGRSRVITPTPLGKTLPLTKSSVALEVTVVQRREMGAWVVKRRRRLWCWADSEFEQAIEEQETEEVPRRKRHWGRKARIAAIAELLFWTGGERRERKATKWGERRRRRRAALHQFTPIDTRETENDFLSLARQFLCYLRVNFKIPLRFNYFLKTKKKRFYNLPSVFIFLNIFGLIFSEWLLFKYAFNFFYFFIC